MEIRKLNPIGYTTQTSDGREYKKSNIGKTALLATAVATDAFICFSKHPLAKSLSLEGLLKNDLKLNIPKKYNTAIKVAQFVIDLSCGYFAGAWIDKKINERSLQNLAQTNSQTIK
mgnify:CR=1 FL=1